MDDKRVLEQPAASSAASDTATRPDFDKTIQTSDWPPAKGARTKCITANKTVKVAEFQRHMVKIRCSPRILAKTFQQL